MIASVRGRVLAVRLDAVVVEVGGIGLVLQATPATVATVRVGHEVELATHLIVREDSLTLFGFAEADEREVFETVQTVSGIGPRLALAMLAVHTPDALRAAVADQDVNALMKVPGIGRKGAQRLLLELTGRLGAPSSGAGSVSPGAGTGTGRYDQVVEALVGLGWSAKQAGETVTAVTADQLSTNGAAPEMAAVLRSALRQLGRTG